MRRPAAAGERPQPAGRLEQAPGNRPCPAGPRATAGAGRPGGPGPREACGIFGIWGHPEAVACTVRGLYALQHRGQESAGVGALAPDGRIVVRKGAGLVGTVFPDPGHHPWCPPGATAAIGHVRYATTGDPGPRNAQPLVFRGAAAGALDAFALAHNGQLAGGVRWRQLLSRCGVTFATSADSEIIGRVAERLAGGPWTAGAARLGTPGDGAAVSGDGPPLALLRALAAVRGAYAVVILTPRGLLAARDPWGIRPLVLGRIGEAWAVASESCALETAGGRVEAEVPPGHWVWISGDPGAPVVGGGEMGAPVVAGGDTAAPEAGGRGRDGVSPAGPSPAPPGKGAWAGRVAHPVTHPLPAPQPGPGVWIRQGPLPGRAASASVREAFCVFEYIYFARPDSCFGGRSVYAVRKELGRRLALQHPAPADVVVGVPDSSLPAAAGYAEAAGLPHELGLVKNRYAGRTFIRPDRRSREEAVRLKLHPVPGVLAGRRVVLVDDSLVRGTTARWLVTALREAGAREVHLRITAPPYRFPCHFGVDTGTTGELLAAGRSLEAVCRAIGADSLAFLSLDQVVAATGRPASTLCLGCFTGAYPLDPGGKERGRAVALGSGRDAP
ncbi:amidophosphoribosyltransferase [Thermaerobacter marianensis DSM 12885]|uniref:Amidophosphoribosyltransferase n=1 Tax=Thermaerobacter marianensis (strain ATCC 700841 / DSM 12885 / JCM 10246 / 7p75a) TaxID=644966 RepID=E6SMP2_THEM7|nr:amidophosphoribosyltransferase [Thermaerobacter marianensis]ADU51534.1 amidophosphoribosyltransferase [Thermaerobacter marianensis DSM 12885]